MAEETAAEEQEQGSQQEEKTSTMDRLKGRLKELTGNDSEDETTSSKTEDSGAEDSGAEDGSSEGEGSDEEAASGEQEDDKELVGGYDLDEVDTQKPTQDDDEARAQINKLERDGPPEKLADWPRGKAMYLTFSGAEGEATYEEAETKKLGPSSTRHHADGSVEVQGEMVEDPSPYKGDKSVFEESEELGMDKGAKGGDEDAESEEGEGSSDAEGSSGEEPQGQSDGSSGAESQTDGSGGAEQEESQSERESAEAS